MLHPHHAPPEVRINLCDTGEGYSQVLPVLLALARAAHGGPNLLCLEQPELHLHTRAQAQLAKVLVSTAKAATQPSILVETHSEVLLTSVQLAIANGDIASKDVRVYWVESGTNGTSQATAVDFDEFGRPNNSMLAVAFDEALALGQQLLAKQMARHKNARAE
jgi:predicted ATPase